MDWDDRLGGGAQKGLYGGRENIEGVGIDVGKDGLRLQSRHSTGSGKKGETGHDDLVPGADSQCHESQEQGITSRGTPDPMFNLAIRGHIPLQFLNFRPQYEGPRVVDSHQCRRNCLAKGGMLPAKVKEGNSLRKRF